MASLPTHNDPVKMGAAAQSGKILATILAALVSCVAGIPRGVLADDCPICRCTLVERDPTWIAEHDAWWACRNAFQLEQIEYGRCVGAVRELERVKRVKPSRAFVVNSAVLTYRFPQHPTEDVINDSVLAHAEVVACERQLGAQIIPEVGRCLAYLDWLRGKR